MTNKTMFRAAVNRITTDHEGETKVTLTVPQNDLSNVLRLVAWTQKVLLVSAEPEDNSYADA